VVSYPSNRTVVRFTAVMAIVAVLDLLSKEIATAALSGGVVPIAGPLDFALVQNRGSAFGISLGAYTWQLNAIATVIALGLATVAVRSLSAVDRLAPIGLGLIAGAAIGNLTSLLVPPAGVADFLSVRLSESARLVMNLADIAAYAGLAMTMRSSVLLSRTIRAHRGVRPAMVRELEIPIPLAVEGSADRMPPAARRDRETLIRPATEQPSPRTRPEVIG
jgi:lipoprotein signal peptidase